jgi:sulfatase maturation enzyme AslB (radical SAM superfamily)
MNNYCPDLFNSVFVQKVNENQIELGHCCLSKRAKNVDTIDINNSFLDANRQYFLQNQTLPPACEFCTVTESTGQPSRRTYHIKPHVENNWWPTRVQLENLDYNCDNICNLKCIMCSSYYSSSWIEDELKLGFNIPTKIKHTKHNDLLSKLNVESVRSVYFNGGEPLMTRDHVNVLSHIINHGDPSMVSVSYSSNGTFAITAELKELWRQFKNVTFIFSIDAVANVFEYVRYPADWDTVDNNIKEFKAAGINVTIFSTIGVHNILYVDQLCQWATENGYPIKVQDTNGRSNLSINNFPPHLLDHLKSYLNTLPNSDIKTSLTAQANQINKTDTNWIKFLNQLDQVRGNSWTAALDRLYTLDPEYFNSFKL